MKVQITHNGTLFTIPDLIAAMEKKEFFVSVHEYRETAGGELLWRGSFQDIRCILPPHRHIQKELIDVLWELYCEMKQHPRCPECGKERTG